MDNKQMCTKSFFFGNSNISLEEDDKLKYSFNPENRAFILFLYQK